MTAQNTTANAVITDSTIEDSGNAATAAATTSVVNNNAATAACASSLPGGGVIPPGGGGGGESFFPPEEHQQLEEERQRIRLIHRLLARQLEYYFSTANLSRDTYVSTLRELNDGYVPVSIVAKFKKVQALAPYESAWDAVIAAANGHSYLLETVELTDQGKKIGPATVESGGNMNTILAVGTVSGEPIPMSEIQRAGGADPTTATVVGGGMIPASDPAAAVHPGCPPSSSSSDRNHPTSSNSSGIAAGGAAAVVQNTVILREVPEDADENTIRSLFNFDDCPSIQACHLDLHNCWFVTLDTSCKDEMFRVMMELRTKRYPSGDSVKARLKSSSSAAATLNPVSSVADGISATHPGGIYDNGSNYELVPTMMYAPPLNGGSMITTNAGIGSSGGNQYNNRNKKRPSNRKGRNNYGNNSGYGNGYGKNINRANGQSSGTGGNAGNHAKRRYGGGNNKDDWSLGASSGQSSFPYNKKNNKKVTGGGKKTQQRQQQPPPPSMGDAENFPSLRNAATPFQVEKVPTDDEMMRGKQQGEGCCVGKNGRGCSAGFSDSSSTATNTSTASTPTEGTTPGGGGVMVPGGYAAALLRPAPPPSKKEKAQGSTLESKKKDWSKDEKQQQQPSVVSKGNNEMIHANSGGKNSSIKNNKKSEDEKNARKEGRSPRETPSSSPVEHPAIEVKAPVWGGGRSFADVLTRA